MSIGTSPARSEPLLWLQLIGLGVLPLEALLLLLLLAGSDPGPLPALERLLCWALGGVAPALLLWRRPADVWSLLLVQVPLRARRDVQQRLSRLQQPSLIRSLGLGAGALLLLVLLWWVDRHAAVAGPFALLASAPRLVDLLLSAALLALMLWQWQQIVQALWLFSRPAAQVAQTLPLPASDAADRRLNLGLPLLLLPPLEITEPAKPTKPATDSHPASVPIPTRETVLDSVQTVQNPGHSGDTEPRSTPEAPPDPAPATDPEAAAASVSSAGVGGIDDGAAIAPEQGAEQAEGDDLNQQV